MCHVWSRSPRAKNNTTVVYIAYSDRFLTHSLFYLTLCIVVGIFAMRYPITLGLTAVDNIVQINAATELRHST